MKARNLATVLIGLSLVSTHALAFTWRDLWQRRDQQGYAELQKGHPKTAAQLFDDPHWRGIAHYRSGAYDKAINAFDENPDELNLFNRSLAHARMGNFDDAIHDLRAVLKKNPDNVKAQVNLDILEKLKQQQKRQHAKGLQNSTKSKAQAQQKEQQQSKKHAGNGDNSQPPVNPNPQPTKAPPPQYNKNADGKPQSEQQPTGAKPTLSQREREQAKRQWLRRIPDDQGTLLQRKFKRDYYRRHSQ